MLIFDQLYGQSSYPLNISHKRGTDQNLLLEMTINVLQKYVGVILMEMIVIVTRMTKISEDDQFKINQNTNHIQISMKGDC